MLTNIRSRKTKFQTESILPAEFQDHERRHSQIKVSTFVSRLYEN